MGVQDAVWECHSSKTTICCFLMEIIILFKTRKGGIWSNSSRITDLWNSYQIPIAMVISDCSYSLQSLHRALKYYFWNQFVIYSTYTRFFVGSRNNVPNNISYGMNQESLYYTRSFNGTRVDIWVCLFVCLFAILEIKCTIMLLENYWETAKNS